jgi:hypothetical protein
MRTGEATWRPRDAASGHTPTAAAVLRRPPPVSLPRHYTLKAVDDMSAAKIVLGWENLMPTFKGQVTAEEIYRI